MAIGKPTTTFKSAGCTECTEEIHTRRTAIAHVDATGHHVVTEETTVTVWWESPAAAQVRQEVR